MITIENCNYRTNISSCPYPIYEGDCREECIRTHMTQEPLLMFEHGSTVYGTNNEKSDVDIVIVVPDKYSDFLDKFPKGIYQYSPKNLNSELYVTPDFEYITKSNYIKLIKEFDIMAIESIFLKPQKIIQGLPSEYAVYFNKNDKWGIRQSFTSVASNSLVKAHKKMTVEKDLDIYCGQKSLFHSLRILDFACQLCEYGEIKNYSSCNKYWFEIKDVENPTWEYYKEKYKPIYNSLRSKLVLLAPKPIEIV